jgi:hypothetical protein
VAEPFPNRRVNLIDQKSLRSPRTSLVGRHTAHPNLTLDVLSPKDIMGNRKCQLLPGIVVRTGEPLPDRLKDWECDWAQVGDRRSAVVNCPILGLRESGRPWSLLVARHPLLLHREDGEADSSPASEDRPKALGYPGCATDLDGLEKALRVVVAEAPEISVAETDDDQIPRHEGELASAVRDVTTPNGRDVVDVMAPAIGAA